MVYRKLQASSGSQWRQGTNWCYLASSRLKGAVANDILKHVWMARANTMDEMIEQCKEPGGGHTLHLLQGARARMMGLHVLGDERATGSRCRTSEMSLTVNPSGITATRLWPWWPPWLKLSTPPSSFGFSTQFPEQIRRSPRKSGGLLSSDHLHANPRLHSTFCGHDVWVHAVWYTP